MPQPTTKRRTGAKAPASRKRTTHATKAPASRKRTTPAARPTTPVDKTAKLSEEVLETVEKSQRVAIESVRKFVDTVDHALPYSKGPSSRQEIVDSALEMADRLIHTQYDFIRKVIDSASKSLSGPDEPK